jgi:hypothetical protein
VKLRGIHHDAHNPVQRIAHLSHQYVDLGRLRSSTPLAPKQLSRWRESGDYPSLL